MLGWLSGTRCAWAQALVITMSLVMIALTPAPRGPMLLISTTGLPESAILNHALEADARLLRSGPLPASLIIEGDRERVLSSLLPIGIIAIRIPDILCGPNAWRTR